MESKEPQFNKPFMEEHQEKTVAETDYDKNLPLILNLEYFAYSSKENEKEKYDFSKAAIIDMGDRGIDLIFRAVCEQDINSYKAVKFLKEINSQKSLSALESLMVSDIVLNQRDRSAGSELVDILTMRNNPTSIAAITRFCEHYLDKMNGVLKDKDKFFESFSEGQAKFWLHDAASAIEALQKFTDKEGYKQAERLYENYKKIQEDLDELKKNERVRIKELFVQPAEIDWEKFPKIKETDIETIDALIRRIYQFGFSYDAAEDIEKLENFGEAAIPRVYQAMQEGRLKGGTAQRILGQYPPEKILAIWHDFLLNRAENSNGFSQKDILIMLADLQNPASMKIIAEFTRRQAELYLKTESEEKKIALSSNFAAGFTALKRFKNKEAEMLKNLLAFTYPELRPLYDEVILSQALERPKTHEQRKWAHSKMYVRGSALFAELLGRSKEKVRDVDIFVTMPDAYAVSESMRVGYFEKIDDLENILSEKEFIKLKEWIVRAGYSNKKINLVRIPESHLSYEESFKDEPKLLLYDEDGLEKQLEANQSLSADLVNYKEGKFYINAQFPETLTPNGTLVRALRLMDLSERFGLNYDSSMLAEAERQAKNSALVISKIPLNQLAARQEELVQCPIIDPPFIKVFEDKKLRKILLQKFPRLGQISEEIVKIGGIENYIKNNFGEIYLDTKEYVKLYDIDLSKSPASRERQKEFLEKWYVEFSIKDFSLSGIEKISDKTELPKPENIERFINQQKLQEAEQLRQSRANILDEIVGRYKLIAASTEPYELKSKIESFLNIMNLNWPAGLDMDKKRTSQTLIKLGVHPKNPVLAQFDSTQEHAVELVISNNSIDILGASVDKPWHSCVCIKNNEECSGDSHVFSESCYGDIAGASNIAYLMKDNKFLARIIIRAGLTLNNFESSAAIEKLYGDKRYNQVMKDAIEKIATEKYIRINEPMMTYPFEDRTYADFGKKKILRQDNFFYYAD